MQIFKRVTSLIMVLIMVVSAMSLSLVASAVEISVGTDIIFNNQTTGLWQGNVTDSGNANDTNATATLDFLDEVLAELAIIEEVKLVDEQKVFGVTLVPEIKISIDATSVDALLGTIDFVKNTLGGAVMGVVTSFIGSLKDLELDNWKTGQSRAKTGDDAVLKNLLSFLADNRALIAAVVDGSFTLGSLADGVLNIDPGAGQTILWRTSLLKNDAGKVYAYLSDYLKDILADVAGMTVTSTTTLDYIIYQGLIGGALQEYVPGFKMDASTTTEQLIINLVNSAWNEYITPLVAKIVELQTSVTSNAYTAPLAGLVNFNVDPENLKIQLGAIEDANDAIGNIIAAATTYKDWADAEKGKELEAISTNLVNALKWVLVNADDNAMSAEVKAKYDAWAADAEKNPNSALLSMVKLVVNAAWPEYAATVDNQATVEGAMIAVLKQLIAENPDDLGFAVINKNSTTAEKFLGDFAGSFLAQYVPLYTDANNTKRYVVGSGTDIYTVANYALNYFLVDLNIDALLGLNMTKSQNLYAKLETLQKMLFGSIDFEPASEFIPSLVENVLSLDIGGIFTDNVKPIIEAYDDLKACNLIYDVLNNVLTSIIGKQVFAKNFTTFEAIFRSGKTNTDDNLGATVKTLLEGINSRKTQLLPIIYYLYNALLTKNTITVSGKATTNINLASSTAQSGIAVKFGAYALKENVDYKIVYANGGKVGTTTVSVQGIGNYVGSYNLGTVKITCSHKYGNWTTTKSATCTANGSKTRKCSVCGNVQTETIKALGHVVVKDAAVSATYKKAGKTEGSHCSRCNAVIVAQKTVAKKTLGKVSGLKAKTIKVEKSSSITLSWSKVTGAQKYEVYIKNGSKWTKLTTTEKTSYTVKKDGKKKALKAGSTYKFKVRAVRPNDKVNGKYSTELSVKVAPKAPTLTLKAGKKQLTASWKSISGASGYEVQYSTSSKMKSAKTVKVKKSAKKTTVKKLKKGKKYYVKVRTYKTVNGKKVYSSWSKVKNVKVK